MARVEAGSLSALNLLAANPPRYPVNPTEEPRDPLTLYISRVPGTRDVILSTLRPQRKTVTYEDVANALYYVHLDRPSDALLAPTGAAAVTREPAAKVARKPVPAAPVAPGAVTAAPPPPPPQPQQPQQAPTPSPSPPPPPPPPHREPVSPRTEPWLPPGFRFDDSGGSGGAPSATDEPSSAASTLPIRPTQPPDPGAAASVPHAPIARKPVGQRQDKALPGPPAPQPSTTTAPEDHDVPPALPPRPRSNTTTVGAGAGAGSPPPTSFVPFSLTLIRRDPSSSHQWNIGKISSVQPVPASAFQAEAPPAAQPLSAPGGGDADGSQPGPAGPADQQPAIRVLLETSGYAKFRSADDTAFARQVVMAYTKSWTAGIRKAFRRHDRSSSDTGMSAGDAAWPGDALDGGGGNSARPSIDLKRDKRDSSPSALTTRPGPGLKPRGYTFASPWGGRCEFRTGNGGRSLRCRHILNPDGGEAGDGSCTGNIAGGGGGGGAGFNPLVIAQSFRDGQGLAAVAAATASITGSGGGGVGVGGRGRATSLSSALTGAVTVSELRFNLPSGELFRGKGSLDDLAGQQQQQQQQQLSPASRTDQLYGKLQHHLQHVRHHRRSSSATSDDDWDDDDEVDEGSSELDLSLGRERAGGGARGKRAKLGKLIVYDDGFKMLDLVVAANVGVWWVSWEKGF